VLKKSTELILKKAFKKLIKLNVKAEKCLTREKAQKLLRKAEKQHQKIFISDF
jgi:hypothetical protein